MFWSQLHNSKAVHGGEALCADARIKNKDRFIGWTKWTRVFAASGDFHLLQLLALLHLPTPYRHRLINKPFKNHIRQQKKTHSAKARCQMQRSRTLFFPLTTSFLTVMLLTQLLIEWFPLSAAMTSTGLEFAMQLQNGEDKTGLTVCSWTGTNCTFWTSLTIVPWII